MFFDICELDIKYDGAGPDRMGIIAIKRLALKMCNLENAQLMLRIDVDI